MTGGLNEPLRLRQARQSTPLCSIEVTVRDYWRRRSRIPSPRPNGLHRSVGARAGHTRCERSGHRCSAPGLHAWPARDPAAVLCGFPQPAHRRVRRQGSVLPVGSRTDACCSGSGVDARLRASWWNRHWRCMRLRFGASGLVVGMGAWRAAVISGSIPHRHRHSRRCGCVVLTGTDRLSRLLSRRAPPMRHAA